MSASSLSLPIFLRINFLISYLIVTDSQNTFDWHTQRALLNDKKAGAGCTSRAFKHPGRDVTAPDVWPSILTDYTYDSELDNADGVPLASRRSSMFPEGNGIVYFILVMWMFLTATDTPMGMGVVNFCVKKLCQIETENRAIAYALSWDRVRQQLAILQMGMATMNS